MRDTGTESLYLLLESFVLKTHLEVQDGLACLRRQGDCCDGPNVVGHGVADLRSMKIMMMCAITAIEGPIRLTFIFASPAKLQRME